MRVLICGSCDWPYECDHMIETVIKRLARDTTIVVGDALGADSAAAQIAREQGHLVEVFWADWRAFGKQAGPIRNRQMLDTLTGKNDCVIAFQYRRSRGTQDTIREARRRNIPVEVHAL